MFYRRFNCYIIRIYYIKTNFLISWKKYKKMILYIKVRKEFSMENDQIEEMAVNLVEKGNS